MCIRVSASTTLVFVAFSTVNFVFPLCKTASVSSQRTKNSGVSQRKLSSTSTLWHQQACMMQWQLAYLARYSPYAAGQMLTTQRLHKRKECKLN